MISAYNRDVSWRKALRKRRIDRLRQSSWGMHVDYYDNLHQYSKNKVHCSCPSCSTKTRNKGRRLRGNYARSINYKKHDLNQMLEMDNQVQEELDLPKIHRRCKFW